MTTLDATVLIVILLLAFAVSRCWRGPIPPALMRPAFTLRMGVDNFTIVEQSADGQWIKLVGQNIVTAQCERGDVLFIEQPSAQTQMFYLHEVNRTGIEPVLWLVRDPEQKK